MPLSYHGFGPAAILIMIISLIIGEIYKKYRKQAASSLSEKKISSNSICQ